MTKQPEFPTLQFVTATLVAFALAASSAAGAQAPVEPAPSVAAPVTAPADSLAPVPSAAPPAPDSPTRGTWTVQGDARAGQVTTAPTSLLRGGPLGELVSIYSPRNPQEIQRQAENAQAEQRMAQGELDASRRNAEAADGQVRIMNEELQTTKTRRDVAKKLKNDADRISLSANTQQQNTEKSYLERLRDALRADADWLESERDAAGARAKAFQAEADVSRKLAQISASASTPYPADLSSYRSLLKQMLDAQKNAANKAIYASSKRKEVADKRLQHLEALSKIGR